MPQQPLTDEEIELLRQLIPVAEEVRQTADYRMARRLVVKSYRQMVIGAGAFLAAMLVFWENLKEWLRLFLLP